MPFDPTIAGASSDSNGPLRWPPPNIPNLLESEVSREVRRLHTFTRPYFAFLL